MNDGRTLKITFAGLKPNQAASQECAHHVAARGAKQPAGDARNRIISGPRLP
jgi:hypothetical protein